MGIAIQLRSDYTADDLQALARDSDDSVQTRRVLSLAEIYDGGARSRASDHSRLGVAVRRGPDGLVDKKPPGAVSRLNNDRRQALVAAVERGPLPAVDGVVRWCLNNLAQWVWEKFGVSVSRYTIGPSFMAWDTSSFRRVPDIMPRSRKGYRRLKKSSPRWRKSVALSR
jgi:hypothetical protein